MFISNIQITHFSDIDVSLFLFVKHENHDLKSLLLSKWRAMKIFIKVAF